MTDTTKAPSRARSTRRFLRDILIILVAAVLISFALKTFLIRSFYIPSASMQNTLQVHDRVVVNELEPRLVPISRGDVVVFTDPADWLGPKPADIRSTFQQVTDAALGFVGFPTSDSNDHLIKRVIGLPGDHVTCCDASGSIEVNGTPIDEPYILVTAANGDSAPEEFDVTVPAGELWVMGDNRDNSGDSLEHHVRSDPGGGFLPEKDVVGRAFVISWPASRWTWLDDYPATFRGTDRTSSP